MNTYDNDTQLTPEDLIYYTDKSGEIKAGGYSINSKLLANNKPIMLIGGKQNTSVNLNLDSSQAEQENISSHKLDNMVIPAGLLYIQQSLNKTHTPEYGAIEVCEMDDVVPEDLYSRLMKLAEVKEQKQKKLSRNKKHKVKKNKNTKRIKH